MVREMVVRAEAMEEGEVTSRGRRVMFGMGSKEDMVFGLREVAKMWVEGWEEKRWARALPMLLSLQPVMRMYFMVLVTIVLRRPK